MLHIARSTLIACLAMAFASSVVPAQQVAPHGVTRASLNAAAVRGDTADALELHSQSYHVFRGAVVGGGVGIVLGLTTAELLVRSSSGSGHSENEYQYAMLSLVGGMVGAVCGALIGSLAAQ